MSDVVTNPYKNQPQKAFWKVSVGQKHFSDLADLWDPMPINKGHKIATAGSCFAQHIGNNLAARGASFIDLEPAPPIFSSLKEAKSWGYGVFSCRYGNIYTTRQLVQLFDEAFGIRSPQEIVWEKNGRFFDALRPSIDPIGHLHRDDVISLRTKHLKFVRKMFETLDVFVFTLGLTEGWESITDATMFPVAPGTIAGVYASEHYKFHNLRHHEVMDDMVYFWSRLKSVNSQARMLLTVSPVPLAATATSNHVLVATSYSKSVLRSVASEMSEDYDDIYYFPSYEIINSHPARGMFFEPDLRNVNHMGVDYVMSHFFSGSLANEFTLEKGTDANSDVICDEASLDK